MAHFQVSMIFRATRGRHASTVFLRRAQFFLGGSQRRASSSNITAGRRPVRHLAGNQSITAWESTLLLITFDEHGGCYNHVLPPTGVTDLVSFAAGFCTSIALDRVPGDSTLAYIQAGTVFRSPTQIPSTTTRGVLATLRDWLPIPSTHNAARRADLLPRRTLAQVLTLSTPRTTLPAIPAPPPHYTNTPRHSPNDLQKSIIAATSAVSRTEGR